MVDLAEVRAMVAAVRARADMPAPRTETFDPAPAPSAVPADTEPSRRVVTPARQPGPSLGTGVVEVLAVHDDEDDDGEVWEPTWYEDDDETPPAADAAPSPPPAEADAYALSTSTLVSRRPLPEQIEDQGVYVPTLGLYLAWCPAAQAAEAGLVLGAAELRAVRWSELHAITTREHAVVAAVNASGRVVYALRTDRNAASAKALARVVSRAVDGLDPPPGLEAVLADPPAKWSAGWSVTREQVEARGP